MDFKYLKTLGPFARVLFEVIFNGESGRDCDDKIKTGKQINAEVSNNMAGAFTIYRGV